MIFFFKKIEPLKLKVDIHSHLLPGIDDGSKEMSESLEIIEKFLELGYEKLIITPHVMEDSYNNSTDIILEKYKKLQKAVNENGMNIKLEVSAEYYVDEEFLKRLENNDLLPIGGKYILFETSYYEKPLNLEFIIFQIQSKGYVPILAHPERYRYIEDMKYYDLLKEKGVLFQCNINSFGNFYGKTAFKKAKYLAKNNMIDFLGSDCHSMKYMETFEKVLKSSSFCKLVKNCIIKNDFLKE